MFSTAYLDQIGLCRLCLIRERVDIPIFEDELSLKINVCLPVKVSKDDKLPKKICVDCFCKLENFYQFYNITEKAEQQLLSWLEEPQEVLHPKTEEDKPTPSELLNIVVKEEENEDNFDDAANFVSNNEEKLVDVEPKPKIRRKSTKKKKSSPVKSNRKLKMAGRLFCEKKGKRNYACTECDERFDKQAAAREHFKNMHVVLEFYKCEHCDKTFNKLHPFKLHRAEHGIDKSAPIFFCDKCNFKTATKMYFEGHVARKHSDVYKFDCHHCGKKFKVKEDIRVHMGVHDDTKHMCDVCGKFYPSHNALVHHRRVKHINTYEFICPICNFKFISQVNLDNHVRDNHDPNNPHRCNECGQQFKVKRYLFRHQKRVHQKIERPHLCTICGKSFICANTYRIHYLTHTKIKPYMCNVCGDTFSQRSSLMLHWKKKHPDAEEPPPPLILTNVFETLQLDKGDNPDLIGQPNI